VQARVSHAAQQRCLPVNVVDRPRLSSFIMPAIVDRAPSPSPSRPAVRAALARRLRAEIERALGRGRRWRVSPRSSASRCAARSSGRAIAAALDRVFAGHIGELALAGTIRGTARADPPARLDAQRNAPAGMASVGAGPAIRSLDMKLIACCNAPIDRLRPPCFTRGPGDGPARCRTRLCRQAPR